MTAVFERPVPTPTPLSQPHWDGCARAELLAQRCDACSRMVFPPSASCPYCAATSLHWEQSSGRGTVYSFTVVHRPQSPAFDAPYVIAVVEVDEGWHLFTNIVGCPVDAVSVGMQVSVQFERVGDATLPFFAPTPPEVDA